MNIKPIRRSLLCKENIRILIFRVISFRIGVGSPSLNEDANATKIWNSQTQTKSCNLENELIAGSRHFGEKLRYS